MPRSEGQKLKLCLIIDFFKKKTDPDHPATIDDIVNYLESIGIRAERKSIYRDIRAMEELGYEVISLHEKRFSYYLGTRDFETAELRTLVDAVQSSRFITKRKSNALIKKLELLATEYDAKKLESQVFVTNRIKTANESIFYNVDAIHNAISENCRISFTYFDWSVKKSRVYRKNGGNYNVSPWALIWHEENYYLIGYADAEGIIKHYRVDRMNSINIIDEPREGKDAFKEVDVAMYAKHYFGMYNSAVERVTLNCANELTNAVIDRFGSDAVFEPQPDGESFNVTAEVAVSPVFLSWVFMFGGKARILSPESAVTELRNMAKKALDEL
ncbi:MAG: WYL domain-containing protein [Clostridia bacterium]|nr:WYL domain-containing protein [Clostridia bacterium]